MGLDEEVLSRFNDNRLKDFWYGPLEELALFNFWKSVKDKEEGSNLQSNDPFDDVLVLPRVYDKKGDRKRKTQEHFPSVATSTKWLEWYNKKDQAKKEQEKAKLARIEQRKLLKEQKEEENLMKKLSRESKQNVIKKAEAAK
ncbi:uncharacterized protein LOC135701082 [Ochlerotatus camptorhynchus]|uniref:uncharacterized protein LOC135701082 n=1 Tax=Ochlerotatus camptorhynchus TaxID=644619 RepID=UPI0031E1ECE5